MEQTQRYLVHFFKKWKYLDFCLPELEALAEMYGTNLNTMYDNVNPRSAIDMKKNSCVYVHLPSDKVAQ